MTNLTVHFAETGCLMAYLRFADYQGRKEKSMGNRGEKERLFEGVSSKDLRLKGCITEQNYRNHIPGSTPPTFEPEPTKGTILLLTPAM